MADSKHREVLFYTEQRSANAADTKHPTRKVLDEEGRELRVYQRETMDGIYDPIGPMGIWMKDAFICSVSRNNYDGLLEILKRTPRLPTDSSNTAVFAVEPGLLPKLCTPKEPIR